MSRIKKTKGFTMLEYTLLIIIVVAAFLGMQIYLKRALSGRWKGTLDGIGFNRQY